jgi:hypothetical protein
MLAALACAALAVRGLWRADATYVTIGEYELGVASNQGSLYLLLMPPRMMGGERFRTFHGDAQTLGRGAWGFRYNGGTYPRIHFVAVPMALPALLCGLIALRLLRRARRGPRDPTLCHVCGYDLRASPDRCPECGTPLAPSDTTAIEPSASRGGG